MTDGSGGAIRRSSSLRAGGELVTLAVDRPSRLNVMGSALIDALTRELQDIASHGATRVVVLRGAGSRAFIGGADINEMATLDSTSARAFITRLHGLCAALRALPCPVVAAIDGYCLGAGMEVAAACDLRVSTTRAQFGMPEVHVGIPSVIDAVLLPGLIGSGKARELVMTGRMIDADEASRCGFLDAVVAPGDAYESAVHARVDALAAGAAGALRAQKTLCNGWDEPTYTASVAASIEHFAAAFGTPEPSQRMQAFLDRNK